MDDAPAPRKPLFAKPLRTLAPSAGIVLMLLLAVLILREQIPWSLAEEAGDERWQRRTLTAVTLLLWCLVPWFWWRRPRWLAVTAFVLTAGAVTWWLAWDDPRLMYPPDDYIAAPDWPGAEESHALVLRFAGEGEPDLPKELLELREPSSETDAQPDAGAWRLFLEENREEILRGWTALAEQRAWIAALAAEPRLADLTTSVGDPLPSFRQLRPTARFMTWHARLLALDGRHDEAAAELTILLEAAQKLMPESRTLFRRMIAQVLQRMALAGLEAVLDSGSLSAGVNNRLVHVLESREPATRLARDLAVGEYPASGRMIQEMGEALAPWQAVFLNTTATLNTYARICHAQGSHAADRDLAAVADASVVQEQLKIGTYRLKNIGGRTLLQLMLPGFEKVVDYHWANEDRCIALLERLK
ncbi:MAG: hypothetical protein ABII82_15140 [Verrucomicrobiota bacterium]